MLTMLTNQLSEAEKFPSLFYAFCRALFNLSAFFVLISFVFGHLDFDFVFYLSF